MATTTTTTTTQTDNKMHYLLRTHRKTGETSCILAVGDHEFIFNCVANMHTNAPKTNEDTENIDYVLSPKTFVNSVFFK